MPAPDVLSSGRFWGACRSRWKQALANDLRGMAQKTEDVPRRFYFAHSALVSAAKHGETRLVCQRAAFRNSLNVTSRLQCAKTVLHAAEAGRGSGKAHLGAANCPPESSSPFASTSLRVLGLGRLLPPHQVRRMRFIHSANNSLRSLSALYDGMNVEAFSVHSPSSHYCR